MTKQNEQEALGTAMNKTEMFFEKNSKSMIIALLALFVLAAAKSFRLLPSATVDLTAPRA